MIKQAKFGKWELRELSQNQVSSISNSVQNLDASHLLDVHNPTKSLLEEFVFNLAQNQLSHYDVSLNIADMCIEFSNECRPKLQDEHYKNGSSRINPLVCSYTFFNRSLTPVFITNLDFEKYKYKEFTDENDIILAFPSELVQISFNGNLYHGFQPVFKNETGALIALKINIYDKLRENLEYYSCPRDAVAEDLQITFKENLYHAELIVDTTLLNRKFLENLLYNKTPTFADFTQLFLNHENNITIELASHLYKKPDELALALPVEITLFDYDNLFIISSQKTPLRQTKYFLQLIKKHGYVMYDVLDYYKCEISNTNRFYKERKLCGFFSDSVCSWITGEMATFNKSTTALNIEQIPHLLRFMLTHFSQIIEFVTNAYGLIDMNINITQIQIIKDANTNAYSNDKRHTLKVVIPLVKNEKYNAGDLIISSLNNPEESGAELNTRIIFYLDFVFE